MERRALREGKRPKILSSERMHTSAPASICPVVVLLPVSFVSCKTVIWQERYYSRGFSFSGCLAAGGPGGFLPFRGAILKAPSWESPVGLDLGGKLEVTEHI